MPEYSARDINEGVVREEFRERRSGVEGRPVQLELELTTRCNLRCFTCSKTYANDRGSDMLPGVFDRLADGTFRTARSLNLTGFGEPMLSPRFAECFERATEAGLTVGMITNGTLLTEDWLDRLAARNAHFFVSVDAATAEVAKGMRPQLNFDRLVSTLRGWPQALGRHEGSAACMRFNFVPTLRNIRELPRVVALAGECGARLVEVLVPRFGNLPAAVNLESIGLDPGLVRSCFQEARGEAARASIAVILPPVLEGELDSGGTRELVDAVGIPLEMSESGSLYPLACSAPWFRVTVTANGNVFPCCVYPYPLGNLQTQNFEDIWNGTSYQRIRRRVNTRFPQYGCKECLLSWGITAGCPQAIFAREPLVNRMHTAFQRWRRDRAVRQTK